MAWVLILIVGGGYAAHSITGFSSKQNCEAAFQVIDDTDDMLASKNGYSKSDLRRFGVSRHYCIPVDH